MDKPIAKDQMQEKLDGKPTEEVPLAAPSETRIFAKTRKVGWLPRTALEQTQLIANFCVIAALVFTAITFWNQQREARRSEAAQMVSKLHSERLAGARSILFRLWADKDLTAFDTGIPASFKEALVRKTIQSSDLAEPDIIEAIVSITNFYDEVEICVTKVRCEGLEVDESLGRYGQSFYCLYRSEIDVLRTRLALPNLGEGLEALVGRQGGC